MADKKQTAKMNGDMAGNRRRRSSEDKNALPTDNMPKGLASALEKVRELNEAEMAPEEDPELTEEEAQNISELRDLLFFGRIKERINIGGYIFELTTLKNKQQKSLISKLVKMDPEQRLLNIKPVTLSLALVSINGSPVEDLYDGDEELDVSEMKMDVISEMQSTLVERLFAEYEKINERSTEVTGLDSLNKQIKK
jgi:hypothetical protein